MFWLESAKKGEIVEILFRVIFGVAYGILKFLSQLTKVNKTCLFLNWCWKQCWHTISNNNTWDWVNLDEYLPCAFDLGFCRSTKLKTWSIISPHIVENHFHIFLHWANKQANPSIILLDCFPGFRADGARVPIY